MKARQITWLAGLVEGEGHIGRRAHRIRLAIGMTDQDVVERAAQLMAGRLYGPITKTRAKPLYFTMVFGRSAVGWFMTLYSELGARRQAEVRAILLDWRNRARRKPNWNRLQARTNASAVMAARGFGS